MCYYEDARKRGTHDETVRNESGNRVQQKADRGRIRGSQRGDIAVERWYMSRLYDMADFYGMDENGSIADEEQAIKRILDAVFAHDYETAQSRIDAETEHRFSLMSSKLQAKASRALVA